MGMEGMIQKMKLLNRILDFVEIYLNGFILLAMSVIIFLQVIFRHLGMPLVWTEEIARFLFVWVIYLSTSECVKHSRHLSIDILPLILGEREKLVLRLISDLIGMVFFCFVAYYGTKVIGTFFAKPQYSQATHTNMIVGYAAPYFCGAMCVIRYVEDIVKTVIDLRDYGTKKGVEAT